MFIYTREQQRRFDSNKFVPLERNFAHLRYRFYPVYFVWTIAKTRL